MSILTGSIALQLVAEQGTDIVIPDSYTSIENEAFYLPFYSQKLTSVIIPSSVTVIGGYAFSMNQLTSVIIPSSVTEIADGAFSGNQLTSIDIPDSVTEIGLNAFGDNPLEIISISADATFSLSVFPEGVVIEYRGVDQSPVDIFPSSTTFDENIAGGSAVATLSTSDPDSGDTHAYALVSGDGDTDNSAFAIDGDLLKIIDSPDFEKKSSYSVRLVTTDSGGLTFEKSFTLTVNDLEEGPLDEDGDGFVDELTNYQMWTESGGVDLQNRLGRTFSDDSSPQSDAVKAVQDDLEEFPGFSVLLAGERRREGQYRVITADDSGVIGGVTPWMRERQMFRRGYEEVFEIDFNGNGVIDFI